MSESFGEARMKRLVALERARDPEDFFRMNRNVKPWCSNERADRRGSTGRRR
ncbi:hypothetical protein [Sorangium sp. So ce1335]|uniref:hypothetical protein n=1 Tax=Sorangium sp. So ce1335 TaxID=3133335 RepID=UPI003F6093E6